MSKGSRREREAVKEIDWIAEYLEAVPFVEWDRFVVGEVNGHQCVDVYGWIERESDSYKDFVWTRWWPVNHTLEFTTSSDEYSQQIHSEWFPEDALDDHNPCRRVEHTFDIPNAVVIDSE